MDTEDKPTDHSMGTGIPLGREGGDLYGRTRGSSERGRVGREAGNPNLRVEVADVGGGVLVALRRVLSQQVKIGRASCRERVYSGV